MARKRKHNPTYVHDSYFSNINTKNIVERVAQAKKLLRKLDFDAIAFTGMSGALLAPPLAVAMGKSLILVRKLAEIGRTHSCHKVVGDAGALKYIIVDDFQDTGKTTRRIKDKVKEFAPKAECLGVHEMHKQYRYKDGAYPLDRIVGE